MQIFLLILFGFFAGIIGGMGMGGGTLLVPLLSFLDIPQKTVQAINLLSFVPMCVVALVLHFKNKLVKTENIGWLTVPAVIFAVGGAFVAGGTSNKVLRIVFGAFLVAVGVWQLIVAIRFVVRQRKSLVVVRCDNGQLKCRKKRKTGKKQNGNVGKK